LFSRQWVFFSIKLPTENTNMFFLNRTMMLLWIHVWIMKLQKIQGLSSWYFTPVWLTMATACGQNTWQHSHCLGQTIPGFSHFDRFIWGQSLAMTRVPSHRETIPTPKTKCTIHKMSPVGILLGRKNGLLHILAEHCLLCPALHDWTLNAEVGQWQLQ
jgi:hypothetical protein